MARVLLLLADLGRPALLLLLARLALALPLLVAALLLHQRLLALLLRGLALLPQLAAPSAFAYDEAEPLVLGQPVVVHLPARAEGHHVLARHAVDDGAARRLAEELREDRADEAALLHEPGHEPEVRAVGPPRTLPF